MSETRLVEAADPSEAFAALADATRVDILRALWDADGGLSFSDLREAVGVRDSGQFNYHLEKLTGRFVRKTDDGYELTVAGQQVNGAISAGAYTMEGTIEPVPLSDPCPVCGGSRTFSYERETVRVECESCDFVVRAGAPPAVFAGCDREDAPAVASRYLRTILSQVRNGFCWHCDGRVAPRIVDVAATAEESDVPEQLRGVPMAVFDCQRCCAETTADMGVALLDHPAVGGFYYEHGVDVRDRRVETFSALTADDTRIREDDPLRASVTYECDGDALTLVVDEALEVVDIERENE